MFSLLPLPLSLPLRFPSKKFLKSFSFKLSAAQPMKTRRTSLLDAPLTSNVDSRKVVA